MEAHPLTIRYYLASNGKEPFPEWFETIRDSKAKAKIAIRLDRLRSGNFGDCKSVGDGILELRLDYGPGYRVYLGQDGEKLVILLCGGDKSSQIKDIAKAKDYWTDYRSQENA